MNLPASILARNPHLLTDSAEVDKSYTIPPEKKERVVKAWSVAENEKQKARIEQLEAMGLKYVKVSGDWQLGHHGISIIGIKTMPDEHWGQIIETLKQLI